EHDGAGGPRAVPQQRPVALELHDGDRDHLRGAAGRDLLRVPPAHDRRLDGRRGQGLARAASHAAPLPRPGGLRGLRGSRTWMTRRARPGPPTPTSGEFAGKSLVVGSTQRRLGVLNRPWRPSWRPQLLGSELAWALAFFVPYVAVLVAFAAFPIGYGLWMASSPSLYRTLFASDDYWDAVVSTALYVGIGVNVNLFLSLLLSGFFMRPRRWVKAMLVVSMLPWALPAQTGLISFHWMLVYWGF